MVAGGAGHSDTAMHFGGDDSLNIAMDYLIRTVQAVKFREVAWHSGVRSRLRLSNLAIRAVERKEGLLKSG